MLWLHSRHRTSVLHALNVLMVRNDKRLSKVCRNSWLTGRLVQGLRDITKEDGALLCFDEVMTGFRIAHGCAQQYFGVTPDLTTMGKVIGEPPWTG